MDYFEPTQVFAGDTIEWRKSLSDYPPELGWTLHYTLKNAEQAFAIDATTTDDGFDYQVSVPTSDSEGWVTGRYTITGYVDNGTEKHVVSTGEITILPNLAGTDPYDSRTHNRKVLDSINAILEGREDVTEYVIGGYSLRTMPIADLLKWQQVYAHRVLKEQGKMPAFVGARFA